MQGKKYLGGQLDLPARPTRPPSGTTTRLGLGNSHSKERPECCLDMSMQFTYLVASQLTMWPASAIISMTFSFTSAG